MTRRILIVGGGLSGLSLAWQCQQLGLEFELIEARGRLGGRVLNHTVTDSGQTAHFDLGPSWFWPGQPRIAELIARLNLTAFAQFSSGLVSHEDEQGQVFRGRGYSSMQGAYRLVGGVGKLIETLARQIDAGRLHLDRRVIGIRRTGSRFELMLDAGEATSESFSGDTVVLAVPPRVIAESIGLDSVLGDSALRAMRRIPTWMAGNAKVLAVYRQAFWRDAGLSGDASSRRGPLVEIHDASPEQGGPYALFGFVGVPAAVRARHPEALIEQSRQQLGRLFGKAALDPVDMTLQDWATQGETSTALDATPLGHHPGYGLPPELAQLCDGRLILASSEVGSEFGGYLEGALAAADSALNQLQVLR